MVQDRASDEQLAERMEDAETRAAQQGHRLGPWEELPSEEEHPGSLSTQCVKDGCAAVSTIGMGRCGNVVGVAINPRVSCPYQRGGTS